MFIGLLLPKHQQKVCLITTEKRDKEKLFFSLSDAPKTKKNQEGQSYKTFSL
jgi:hypothetical protein